MSPHAGLNSNVCTLYLALVCFPKKCTNTLYLLPFVCSRMHLCSINQHCVGSRDIVTRTLNSLDIFVAAVKPNLLLDQAECDFASNLLPIQYYLLANLTGFCCANDSKCSADRWLGSPPRPSTNTITLIDDAQCTVCLSFLSSHSFTRGFPCRAERYARCGRRDGVAGVRPAKGQSRADATLEKGTHHNCQCHPCRSLRLV